MAEVFGRVAGELGFEPRQTESESVVLPLHHSPRILNRFNDLWPCAKLSGNSKRRDDESPAEVCALLTACSRAWQARGDRLSPFVPRHCLIWQRRFGAPGWLARPAFRRAAISLSAGRPAQLAPPRHQISGCVVREIKLGGELLMSRLFTAQDRSRPPGLAFEQTHSTAS